MAITLHRAGLWFSRGMGGLVVLFGTFIWLLLGVRSLSPGWSGHYHVELSSSHRGVVAGALSLIFGWAYGDRPWFPFGGLAIGLWKDCWRASAGASRVSKFHSWIWWWSSRTTLNSCVSSSSNLTIRGCLFTWHGASTSSMGKSV